MSKIESSTHKNIYNSWWKDKQYNLRMDKRNINTSQTKTHKQMTNESLKRRWPSPATREMKTRAWGSPLPTCKNGHHLKDRLHPAGITHCGWGENKVQLCWETFVNFFKTSTCSCHRISLFHPKMKTQRTWLVYGGFIHNSKNLDMDWSVCQQMSSR